MHILEGPAGEVTSKKRLDRDTRQESSMPLDDVIIIPR